jgi:hypothetical protein
MIASVAMTPLRSALLNSSLIVDMRRVSAVFIIQEKTFQKYGKTGNKERL